jgi:hypothetical protein
MAPKLTLKRICWVILVVSLLVGRSAVGFTDDATMPVGMHTDESVKALALQWFTQMQSGQIDRTQLDATYSAQLRDDAVQQMSRKLKEYGASPMSASILKSRTTDEQAFYLVKLVFPRGDAAAMLVGFNSNGKITGIDFVSMAGD